MKSFCIKTNNKAIINYLLKSLNSTTFENIFYIHRKFAIYENVIVHYNGNNLNSFCVFLADLLADTVLLFYEPMLIRSNINYNYFYFDDDEKDEIEENCLDYICDYCNAEFDENKILYRKNEISVPLISYILENKTVILDGFVNFRLQNYLNTIDEIVEYGVSKYVVEKEYIEFINLLKIYIDSKESTINLVHLIYTNGDSILLDEDKNLIPLDSEIFNAKYLSDISFSSADYTLNALLTLIPKHIEIHLIGCEDEFINTLKLIFGNKILICKECNLCRTYRILNNVKL